MTDEHISYLTTLLGRLFPGIPGIVLTALGPVIRLLGVLIPLIHGGKSAADIEAVALGEIKKAEYLDLTRVWADLDDEARKV